MPRIESRSIQSFSFTNKITLGFAVLLIALIVFANGADGQDFDLRVMKNGLGSGTITSNVNGIDCGGDCDESYEDGTVVILTARADPGSTFEGWVADGDDVAPEDANTDRRVTMSADSSVRAVFKLAPGITTLKEFFEDRGEDRIDWSPEGIDAYLLANQNVDTPAKFISALPETFRQNWVLMTRSESLQTGTAKHPRVILRGVQSGGNEAEQIFTIGLATNESFPGSHPNAIEYMQWDAEEKNFRLHEIIVHPQLDEEGDPDEIRAMGELPSGDFLFPARRRGVKIDDAKCTKCHSTGNVRNVETFPVANSQGQVSQQVLYGTTGAPNTVAKAKNRPNWDAYDSWAGMLPFNRDRIYQGSVEAAAFRKIFNLWTWRDDDDTEIREIRRIIEQLKLQPTTRTDDPPMLNEVRREDQIKRTVGGPNDGHINFWFDHKPTAEEELWPNDPDDPQRYPPVLEERPLVGDGSERDKVSAYSFNRVAGVGDPTDLVRGGDHVTLRHEANLTGNDEGRGVRLFDTLGGLGGDLNQQRIADELKNHRYATGSVGIDVRPIALAIAEQWVVLNANNNAVVVQKRNDDTGRYEPIDNTDDLKPLQDDLQRLLPFFVARHGLDESPTPIADLCEDTRERAFSLPRRKADLQRANLDRSIADGMPGDMRDGPFPSSYVDFYLVEANPDPELMVEDPTLGLIQEYGAATRAMDTTAGDDVNAHFDNLRQEVFRRPIDVGYPDRTPELGGIAVDREDEVPNIERVALYRFFLEPLGVAIDQWSMGVRGRSLTYSFADVFGSYEDEIKREMRDSLSGEVDPNNQAEVLAAVNMTLSSLPAVDAVPRFTDVQRIFNKACIECHGGLGYPPYSPLIREYYTRDFSENEDPTEDDIEEWGRRARLARSWEAASELAGGGNLVASPLYQFITQPDEYCSIDMGLEGVMPCGGVALSFADKETIRRWIEGPEVHAFTVGDPHIRTIDGVMYDFHAAGEFVLLRGFNVEIQTRQTAIEAARPLGPNAHTGLTSCVAVNGAVAVRVGSHRITYQPNLSGKADPDGLQLRVDGQLEKMSEQGIPLASGARIIQTSAPGGIQIEAPDGTVIVITSRWWDHYQLWILYINVRQIRATQGLAGSIASGNWLPALPDGTLLGPRPNDLQKRYEILYGVFRDAWRVTDQNSLFDYAAGTSTATFTLKSWPGGESPNDNCELPQEPREPLEPLPAEVAKSYCAGIVDPDLLESCIQDVMVTGDPTFAETYLMADKIDRNAYPGPPALLLPLRGENVVASPVTFAWDPASDSDGDPVTYRHYVWPAGESPNFNDAEPVSVTQSSGFIRGDSNSNGSVDISDALFSLMCKFVGVNCPDCMDVADSNDDGEVDISDAIYTLVYLYLGGQAPPSPFPKCGPDSTEDKLPCKSTGDCPAEVTTMVSQLEPGAYYWIVFAEDGNGGTVPSEARRFQVE